MWGVSSPSAFNISAHTPSSPGALSFLNFYIAFCTLLSLIGPFLCQVPDLPHLCLEVSRMGLVGSL